MQFHVFSIVHVFLQVLIMYFRAFSCILNRIMRMTALVYSILECEVDHWDGGRKQKHIGSAVDYLSSAGVVVRGCDIVLVDDDLLNVEEVTRSDN